MQAICLWSGPRNVSTALMYSFAQRTDTTVVDEPLYGHYLTVSNADHPGRDEITRSMNCDGAIVMHELLNSKRSTSKPLLFLKHMAHHLIDLDRSFLKETKNVLLIRDPREMLPSLTVQLPNATLADTGLAVQSELFDTLQEGGANPVVVDSREIQLDPAGVISALCQRLGIEFQPNMLHWPKGGIAEDGVWAKHWYHAVHKSAGFAPYVQKRHFPEALTDLLDTCSPHYERLYRHAIRANAGG